MKKYYIFITIVVSILASCVGKYSTENYVQTEIFDDFNGGLYVSGVSTYYGIDAIDYKLKELGFKAEALSDEDILYELKEPSIETLRILTYNIFDEEVYQATKSILYEVQYSKNKGYLRFMTIDLCDVNGRDIELTHSNIVHSNDRLLDMCETSVKGAGHRVYCNKELYGFWEVDERAMLTCVPFVYDYN